MPHEKKLSQRGKPPSPSLQIGGWLLFILSLTIFLAFRLHIIWTKPRPQKLPSSKPSILEPVARIVDPLSLLPLSKADPQAHEHFTKIITHPWIQAQSSMQDLSIEMVRDIELLEQFCEQIRHEHPIENRSNEKITEALIQTLTNLQSQLPFSFPEELYNVLCIIEAPQLGANPPRPFHVYQRLYLGETELGFPFYLDVRLFELKESSAQEIIDWHFNALESGKEAFETLVEGQEQKIYTGKGYRNPHQIDPSHGFSHFQGERGIYINCIEKEGRLFVAWAEAPLKTFNKHAHLFEKL